MINVELLTVARLITNYDAAVALVNNTAKTHALTVPAGKRWFLIGGYMTNGDDVNRNASVSITDGTNVVMYVRASSSLTAGATFVYPPTTASNSNVQVPAFIPLDQGWKVSFYWATGGASTGGNSTISALVLEIDIK